MACGLVACCVEKGYIISFRSNRGLGYALGGSVRRLFLPAEGDRKKEAAGRSLVWWSSAIEFCGLETAAAAAPGGEGPNYWLLPAIDSRAREKGVLPRFARRSKKRDDMMSGERRPGVG